MTNPSLSHLLRVSLVAVLLSFSVSATAATDLWVDVSEDKVAADSATRQIVPTRYRTLRLDLDGLQRRLESAPMQFTQAKRPILSLPLPDGELMQFEVEDSPIMQPGLAARHPDIRTFRGYAVDRPGVSARFGWTPRGFHAIVFLPGETVYIDPYSRTDSAHYISYRKADYADPDTDFQCLVEGHQAKASVVESASPRTPLNGQTLRTYRLAMAANYEYTQFHSGPLPALPSKAAALAAIVVTMNRVNGIYERDVAVNMVLIDNEEMIIFDTPADPYVNEDGLQMLAANPGVLDAAIGSANYDIGHVFSTGGGGIAGLGVVCKTGLVVLGHKANGVTGRGSPVGDPFDVDYVAHEIGHQFGGNHTFNGSAGSCSGGNRNGSTAYEVGSGTTIMAYAGICGAQNTQSNSDDLFHLASLLEITAYINGGGNVCAAGTPTGNTIPVVDAGPDFVIPKQTPFKLTAVGSDADGDTLGYAWEQFDLGPAGAGTTDNGSSPLFRAFNTVPSPVRTLPQNADFPAGPFPYGELLPTTNRTMRFRVTARDNRAGGGAVAWDEMTVQSVASAEFDVVYPNGGELWSGGSTETVLWTFTNTDQPPIDTQFVDILLSTDGGETYELLVEGVPNDGSQDVVVPGVATTDAVIKVKAAGNIYFEISAAVFEIEGADFDADGIIDDLDNCIRTPNADQADGDEDGYGDVCDNCTLVANPSQCDTDSDLYGNACDADLDNNGIINSFDLNIMRANFGASGENDSDLDCNATVNSFDLARMRTDFGGMPGPSAFR